MKGTCIFLTIFSIIIFLFVYTLPVSAAVSSIPYTPSDDSFTTDGKYLRFSLRNTWGDEDCETIPLYIEVSSFISVTFTISGLGTLTVPYQVSLVGTTGDLTFWGDAETDTATPGTIHITRDGTYQVQTELPHAVSTIDCLILQTTIPLSDYTDQSTAEDTGITIVIENIETERTENSENLLGDADHDQKITVQDAVLVLTYYAKQAAGTHPETDATFSWIQNGDVDQDDIISVQDAVHILTYYAKQAAGLNPKWVDLL